MMSRLGMFILRGSLRYLWEHGKTTISRRV